MSKTASAPVTSHERYAHTTGYKLQRIAGPMSETVLEAAINVSPTPAAAQGYDGRSVATVLCLSFPEATQVDTVSIAVLLWGMALALAASNTKRRR